MARGTGDCADTSQAAAHGHVRRVKTRELRDDEDFLPGDEPLNRPCLSCIFGITVCGCDLRYGRDDA